MKNRFATHLNNRALLYYSQGHYSEAEPLYLRSLQIREQQLGADHPSVAISLNNLANLYQSQGRYSRAETLYLRSLQIREQQLGADHPDTASSLNHLAAVYYWQGRYSEAEPLYVRSQQIWGQQLGANHPNVATSLNNLAQLYRAQGRYSEAESLFLRSLQIREQRLGDNHPDVIGSLINLAGLYQAQGCYSDAEPLFLRSLQIMEQQQGAHHRNVTACLNNLAELYREQGRYSDAEPLYLRSLQIGQHQLGADHPDVCSIVNNLAGLYQEQGRYGEAEPLYLRSLQIREQQLGADHSDVATCLNNLAQLYQAQGRYSEAEPLYLRSLQIWEQQLGAAHPDVTTCLNNLGYLYVRQGRYSNAEPLYLQSLQIRKQRFGNNHPNVAGSLNHLAGLYEAQGRYGDAEPLYLQSLRIMEQQMGADHFYVAACLNNLAGLYEAQGRYSDVEPLYLRALQIGQHQLGADHPDVCSIVNNLAGLYRAQGRYSEAEPLYLRSLQISEQQLGADHPDVATSLNNLAELYRVQGRYGEVEPLYLRSLQIKEQQLGTNHPDVATSLNNLGYFYRRQRRYSEAEPLLLRSLQIDEQQLGADHPNVAISLNNLAVLYAVTQQPVLALERLLRATIIELKQLSQAFQSASEDHRLTTLQQSQDRYYKLISLALQFLDLLSSKEPSEVSVALHHQAIQAAYSVVLKRKALTATAQATFSRIIASQRYPHLNEAIQTLRNLQAQRDHQTLHPPQVTQELPEAEFRRIFDQHQANLAALKTQIQTQEQALVRQIPELRLEQELRAAEVATLSPLLSPKSALLDFVRFPVYDFKSDQHAAFHYIAFVLPAGATAVQLFDLGEATQIDQFLQRWRQLISVPTAPSLDFGAIDPIVGISLYDSAPTQALADLLLPPALLTLLPQKIFISPDGQLNLLPFQLLPPLADRQITYLTAGRDLLTQHLLDSTPKSLGFIITDPDYDLTDPNSSQLPPSPISALAGYCRPVPTTAHLNQALQQWLPLSPYTQANALETNLAQHPSPHILVIATHGICEPAPEPELPTSPISNSPAVQTLEDPMLRSGLALAGFNTWSRQKALPPAAGKGFVTSRDIANLDLSGNALSVVLACNSGVGDIFDGEGVYGLRRAFATAGAQTLILSLWPVPEAVSVLLILHFFEQLRLGISRVTALQNAQTYIQTITVHTLLQWPVPEAVSVLLILHFFEQLRLGISRVTALQNAQTYIQTITVHTLLQTDLGRIAVQQWADTLDDDALAPFLDQAPFQHPFYWAAWICQGDDRPLSWGDATRYDK